MLGEFIRAKRYEKGYSMDDLAGLTGLTKNSIVKIETGKTQKLRVSTMRKLADALDIPYKVLAGEIADIPMAEAHTAKVPVYPQNACKTTFFNTDRIESYVSFDSLDDMLLLSEIVGIKVETTSMQPHAYKGDIIILKTQPSVNVNEVAVVYNADKGIQLRHIKMTQQGMLMASPDHYNYTERITWVEAQQIPVVILGKLLEIRRFFTNG